MRFRFILALPVLLLLATSSFAADAPQDARKHTKLGKYVTAVEAYGMWKANPAGVSIIDVRTPEEYDFTGHPEMAANVPSMLWTGRFDAQKKAYALAENPGFVDAVRARHKPGDAIIVMCRSGQRSAMAANKLAEVGFTNVYSVVDGFEGEKVADKASPNFGKRLKDGWRNTVPAWTTDLDEKLVYAPK